MELRPVPQSTDTSSTSSAAHPVIVTPVVRGPSRRTVGVVVDDGSGARWQSTPDVEGLVRLGTVAAAAVARPVGLAVVILRPVARVDRLSMGPGGWVSFRGFAVPE